MCQSILQFMDPLHKDRFQIQNSFPYPDASSQLWPIEGFTDIVICASLKTCDNVLLFPFARQKNDVSWR